MWVSFTFAAIAFSGAAFMVRYLIALLRESSRLHGRGAIAFSTKDRSRSPQYFETAFAGGNYAERNEHRDYCVALLESKIHAKEASGLITLAIVPNVGTFRRRPKLPGWLGVHHQHWFD